MHGFNQGKSLLADFMCAARCCFCTGTLVDTKLHIQNEQHC